ncbi:UNVERIFIED_CONTAM: hypothetical protein FKN15_058498 [Acipenser sinensis]
MLDVCLTCLKGEEWCFAVGEVGHVAPDQPPPWQEREEPECSAPMWEDCPEQEPEDEESVHPQPKRGEAERPQPKAPLAGEKYLLVSPPPPSSKGEEKELPLHPPRWTGPLSSEGIWDWLMEPEGYRGGPPRCDQPPVGKRWGALGGLETATPPCIPRRYRSHGAQLPGCRYGRGPAAMSSVRGRGALATVSSARGRGTIAAISSARGRGALATVSSTRGRGAIASISSTGGRWPTTVSSARSRAAGAASVSHITLVHPGERNMGSHRKGSGLCQSSNCREGFETGQKQTGEEKKDL